MPLRDLDVRHLPPVREQATCCRCFIAQFCIDKGLDVMEPGAGGGDFKFLRGFDPAIVNSCHYCTHPGLRGAVRRFQCSNRCCVLAGHASVGLLSILNS